MKKHFTLILFFLISLTNAQEKKWGLQECLDYAHQHNLQLKQSLLEVDQAKINKTGAVASFFPNLNSSASASWNSGLTKNFTTGILENQTNFGGSGSISSNIDIFRGFQKHYNYKKSLLEIISAQYQFADMQKNIDIQIASAYLQILLAKENFENAKQQLENSIKQKEKTQEMIRAGALPKGDLMDSEAQITNDNLKLIQAENTYELAKLSLVQLLEIDEFENIDINENIENLEIDEKLLHENPSSLLEKALIGNDKIKKSEAQKQISDYQIKLAKSHYLPSLSGFANINTRYSDQKKMGMGGIVTPADPLWTQVKDNRGLSYGLSLNIPIFNNLSARSQVESAKLGMIRNEIALETTKKQLKNDVYKMQKDLLAAFQSMKAAEANLKAQQKAYDYAMEKFNVGMLNIFDLNTIKTKYASAENQYINAKYQYYMKSKILEFTVK